MPLYPARSLLAYNVLDFGAKGDGTSDDTAAITAALSAASSGGEVYFPVGTYITTTQTLAAKVHLRGAGIEATTIKLKNSTNADLFSAQTGSINLSAAFGAGSAGSLYNFGIYDMTLDGNKANQSSGTSYPLRFYGYGYILQNLRVKNGRSGGILSDWNGGSNSPGQDSMEAQWSNIKVHDCGGIGIQVGGPHDTQMTQVISYLNGSHCFHFAPNSTGMLLEQCHAWGPPASVSAVGFLVESGLAQFTNCLAEGSDFVNVALLANQCNWFSGSIFGAGVFTCTGLQIGQAAGSTPIPSQINQSAGVTTAVGVSGCVMVTNFSRCEGTNGTINFVNDQGNMIIGQCYITAGNAIGGNVGATMLWLRVNGATIDGSRGRGGALLFNGSAFSAVTFTDSATGNDVFNINTNAFRFEMVNNTEIKGYSDNYSTVKYRINPDGAGSLYSSGYVAVGQSGSAASLATSGTIAVGTLGSTIVAPTGNVTGVILASGTTAGQEVTVTNQSAFTITMAASGTSHVADGVSDVIAANNCRTFKWNSLNSLWSNRKEDNYEQICPWMET
jgi:hypothetical protein